MPSIRLILSASWVAVMLVYLLGDVLRIFSGDVTPGEIFGKQSSQALWLGIAAFMLIPILIAFSTLILPQPIARSANIILAVIFFLFNVIGVPTYPSAYDKFLIIVSLGFNAITVWYAWGWV